MYHHNFAQICFICSLQFHNDFYYPNIAKCMQKKRKSNVLLWKIHNWMRRETRPLTCVVWTDGGNQTGLWVQTADMYIDSTFIVQSTLLLIQNLWMSRGSETVTDSLCDFTLQPLIWEIGSGPVWYFSGLALLLHCPSLGLSWASSKLLSCAQRCHFFPIKGPQAPTINKAGVN